MKELLKSKVMIGFAVFVLGVAFFNASYTKKLDAKTMETEKEMVVMNIQ